MANESESEIYTLSRTERAVGSAGRISQLKDMLEDFDWPVSKVGIYVIALEWGHHDVNE